MQRRNFITLLCGTAAIWPLAARSQPRKMPRVGVIWHAANADEEDVYLSVLTKTFADLGYVDGKNIQFEHRFADEMPARFRAIAKEFVEARVEVIIASTALGATEAKQATNTIPIVFVAHPDPVGSGLVASLAHPGGNATGLSLMAIDVSAKRLSMLRELVPNLARMAIMLDPRDSAAPRFLTAYVKAAEPLGISTRLYEVTSADGIERTFSAIAGEGFEAAALAAPILLNERVRVGAAALAHRIPTLSGVAEMVPRPAHILWTGLS